jgi:hypothetical protein
MGTETSNTFCCADSTKINPFNIDLDNLLI